MILLPKYRDLIIPTRAPVVRMRGRYKLEIMKPDGRIRQTIEFPNLITNNGLDILSGSVGSGNWSVACAVGSGNTAPAVTDTALVSLVATTSTQASQSNTIQSTSPYFSTAVTTWQFAQGAAAGNLSEVGVGPSSTSLFSRALILDSGGVPTTITVLSNEFLNVTYTLENIVPTADVTGTITLAGVNYSYTIRASRATNSSVNPGWGISQYQGGNITSHDFHIGQGYAFLGTSTIGAVTGNPTGTQTGGGTRGTGTYSIGSYNLTDSWTWGINDGNLTGGIGAMEIQWGNRSIVGTGNNAGGRGIYQIGFSPAIPKDNTKQLTLNFNIAWTRM